ncbi:MAG TPA: bifunctional serine/threonine-protein kinase/formylglycine-generating enzyme family protein [Planctomycetaceae bacterium]|jgi:serine/threonine protein kinase/formylglycine-generating enzyme required for sulfatase activity|nr:bifunctional serine/threonine-protein kinase/formylglycine-generating enzyme family protein [Planctomycetaceae bacterium]
MNDPVPSKPNDPRLQAALEEYLDRVDRQEPVDRESFLAQHQEIAAELRLFIATEDELRRFAAESRADVLQISTGSFGQLAKETLAARPQSSPTELKSGELRGHFGRYRILRSLGQGAMGTVYLAHDTQLERQIALKTPQFTDDSERELLERFYREARLAATLRHPRICPVYDVGDIDGKHYITMAYIEGRPLSEFVNPASPQTEQQILIAVGKIAQALQEAHNHGIVHRDLKPANIMVDRQGEPVIMDFGLAQQMRPGEDVRLTQTGMIIGSPAYMSPEQVEGEVAKIGPAADQYGLGVILYELLTGKVPFEGSLASVMGQIVSVQPTPPSRLRPGLDRQIDSVCLKMLAKDPADRFPSLSAVADELATIVRKPSVKSASQQLPRSGWDRWALPSATVVALLGLLALAILYFRVGKSVLAIEISDPGVQVALRGSKVTLTGPGNEEVQVEPGENELTITHGNLKFKTNTFTLEKGNTQVVKVSVAGPTVAAKLGDQDLTLIPLLPGPVGRVAATQQAEVRAQPPAAVDLKARGPRPHLLASPFDRSVAKTAQELWAKYCKVPIETTNSLGMKLELIPPGAYMMGPYAGHHVRITRPCYFGVYEVTRGQFAQFVAVTGYQTLADLSPGGIRLDNSEMPTKWEPHQPYAWRTPGFPQGDDHPVVQVAWQDATAFCDWLSRKEGKTYRLPTEAEWEYACRAGTATRTYYSADAEDTTKIGNVADATAKAIFPHWKEIVKSSDGYAYTSPVGKFLPNNFGLYDMIGNAAEWCSDRYAADYFQHSPTDDPTGPPTGDARIGRGGGFTHVAGSRYRYWGVDSFRRPDWGFRVVCDLPAAAHPTDSAKAR